MFKLDFEKKALDFWNTLDAKQYRQIGRKIFSLLVDPHPNDSESLIGHSAYLRVDFGEYRIIYTIEEDIVKISLIGLRNDSDVYKKMKRKLSHCA